MDCYSMCSKKYNTLQHTATHCSTLQHTAAHCNTLQHTAAHCNTLQAVASANGLLFNVLYKIQNAATHCNTLQHTATHCTLQHTLQHTATHCRQWRAAQMACSQQNPSPLCFRQAPCSRARILKKSDPYVLYIAE